MPPNKSNNAADCAAGFASKLLAGGPVVIAAEWYAANSGGRHSAFIPILHKRFNLTPLQAIQAAKLARQSENGGGRDR